jgi:hypothetical protein
MPSATSMKDAREIVATPASDQGFRPWHFFVLASLVAATAAVVVSRRATPEHLVLISVTIAAAGLAAAALYGVLAPLVSADASTLGEPLSERSRAALEREKLLVLRSLKELEFDRAMGKLSPRDFDEMAGRLRARALSLMKQLDEDAAGYRTLIERELSARLAGRSESTAGGPSQSPAGPDVTPPVAVGVTCASCGTVNDDDAAFCKRCGGKVR